MSQFFASGSQSIGTSAKLLNDKETEMYHAFWRKETNQTGMTQMLQQSDKDFKIAVIIMVEECLKSEKQ